jgi:SWI/SNF-related matrix-associated actin-dependent regulator 1 of chromatin subfamily A
MGRSKLMLDGRVAGEEEEAGEKAVEKMLLEGVTITDEEAAAVVEGKPEEETAKSKAKGKKSGLPARRKSTLLDLTTEDGAE